MSRVNQQRPGKGGRSNLQEELRTMSAFTAVYPPPPSNSFNGTHQWGDALRLGCVNIHGLSLQSIVTGDSNKLDAIQRLLSDEQLDILAVSETWLTGNHTIDLPGYFYYGVNGPTTKHAKGLTGHGGVGFLYRTSINTHISRIEDRMSSERVWIGVHTESETLYLCSVYGPSTNDMKTWIRFTTSLSDDIDHFSRTRKSSVCILGDFNARMGFMAGLRGESTSNRKGEHLLDVLAQHRMVALNTQDDAKPEGDGPLFTRCAGAVKSVIDYVIVPTLDHQRGRYQSARVVYNDNVFSDHVPITTAFRLRSQLRRTPEAKMAYFIWKFRSLKEPEIQWDRYYNALAKQSVPILQSVLNHLRAGDLPDQLDQLYDLFVDAILAAATSELGQIKVKGHGTPWWKPSLNTLRKARDQAIRRWRLEEPRQPRAINHRPPVPEYVRRARKEFKKAIATAKREYDSKTVEIIERLKIPFPRFHHKRVQAQVYKRTPPGMTLRKPDGSYTEDQREVVEAWEKHFRTASQPLQRPTFDDAHRIFVEGELQRAAQQAGQTKEAPNVAALEKVLQTALNECLQRANPQPSQAPPPGASPHTSSNPAPVHGGIGSRPAVAAPGNAPQQGTRQQPRPPRPRRGASPPPHADLDDMISSREVALKLVKLDGFKAGGADNILPEMLRMHKSSLQDEKSASGFLPSLLAAWFNVIYQLEKVPRSWTQGRIFPLFKTGDTADPNNYRAITLLSVISKTFEAILADRLYAKADSDNLLEEAQGGFRVKRGCRDQILVLTETLEMCRSERRPAFVAFLDVRKAYDTVWHEGLFHKLWSFNIRGKFWRLFRTWYERMESCVLLNGTQSAYFPVKQGLRQGGTSSPLLYNLFLTGLAKELEDKNLGLRLRCHTWVGMLLYADDMALMANTEDELQSMLQHVDDYANKWRFEFNPSKSKVMQLTPADRPRPPVPFTLGGATLENVDTYRYLGVLVQAGGGWEKQEAQAMRGAENRFKEFSTIGLHKQGITPNTSRQLYQTYVRPVAEYGAEIWHSTTKSRTPLDKQVDRHGRTIMGLRWETPHEVAEGDMQWWPHSLRADKLRLRYWWHINSKHASKMVRAVCRLQQQRPIKGLKSSFFGHMRKTFVNHDDNEKSLTAWWNKASGLRDVPEYPADTEEFNDHRAWKKQVDMRVAATFRRRWEHRLVLRPGIQPPQQQPSQEEDQSQPAEEQDVSPDVMPTLQHYLRIKGGQHNATMRPEPYLRAAPQASHLIAQLRSRCNNLRVSSNARLPPGQRLPRDQRLCLACKSVNEIEDEEHFVMHCAALHDQRSKMWHVLESRANAPSFTHALKEWTVEEKFLFILGGDLPQGIGLDKEAKKRVMNARKKAWEVLVEMMRKRNHLLSHPSQ